MLHALTFCDCAPTDWGPPNKPVAGRTGFGMSFSVAQEEVIKPMKVHDDLLVAEVEEIEEEWEYLDESQVYLRSKFFESWLWMDVSLPSEADRDGWVMKKEVGTSVTKTFSYFILFCPWKCLTFCVSKFTFLRVITETQVNKISMEIESNIEMQWWMNFILLLCNIAFATKTDLF